MDSFQKSLCGIFCITSVLHLATFTCLFPICIHEPLDNLGAFVASRISVQKLSISNGLLCDFSVIVKIKCLVSWWHLSEMGGVLHGCDPQMWHKAHQRPRMHLHSPAVYVKGAGIAGCNPYVLVISQDRSNKLSGPKLSELLISAFLPNLKQPYVQLKLFGNGGHLLPVFC